MHYNYIIYIGRFQPFHNGHKYIIDQATNLAEHVLIICGDSELSQKNPWKFDEIQQMIRSSYSAQENSRINIASLKDYPTDQEWIAKLKSLINKNCQGKIALIGHHKDNTSYYLDLLPEIEYIEVSNYLGINATDIRRAITEKRFEEIKDLVPASVYEILMKHIPSSLC